MLELRRWTQRLRPQALLQPLAHGITDRSAGLAVDCFWLVGDSAVHDGFRCVFLSDLMPNQVSSVEIVSRRTKIAGLGRKECMTWLPKNKAPARRAGAL